MSALRSNRSSASEVARSTSFQSETARARTYAVYIEPGNVFAADTFERYARYNACSCNGTVHVKLSATK